MGIFKEKIRRYTARTERCIKKRYERMKEEKKSGLGGRGEKN